MRKNLNTTLILGIVLGLLAAWYAFYEKKFKVELSDKEAKTKRLISLDADAITEATYLRLKNAPKEGESFPANFKADYETIKLEKQNGNWKLLLPVEDETDLATVTSSLSTLTTTQQERIVDENPKDLAQYGLNFPFAKITVKKDSTVEELWVGANTPVGFSAYAKLASKPEVFKVSRSLRTTFEKDVFQYRNKQVITWKRDEIGEMEIILPNESVVLKKSDKDWVVARDNLPADPAEVGKNLSALIEFRAQSIVSDSADNAASFGLKPPAAKLVLRKTPDGKPLTVYIGKGTGERKDKYFAKFEDKNTIYEIMKTSFDPFLRKGSEYRDMHIAQFNRFDTKQIKWERGEGSFTLAKPNTEWQMTDDPKAKVDGAQVDAFLARLQDGKIVKYLSTKQTIAQPKLVLRLFEKKEGKDIETLTLSFAEPKGKEVVVQRKGLDLLYTIREEEFHKLYVPKTSFIQQEKKEAEKKAS